MFDQLVDRVMHLIPEQGRAVLGITGCPGAGKSALADSLVDRLDPQATWALSVPMDGFHLANATLDRLGRRARKGAIETFDAYGYLALLRRIRTETGNTVYAPNFDRTLEDPIAGTIAVEANVRLVVTEGNYLLSVAEPWPQVRREIAEVWYVDIDDDVRRDRLAARHVRFGKTETAARRWVEDIDEANARLIGATRDAADLVIDISRIDLPQSRAAQR